MNDMTDDEQLVIRKAIQCAHDNGLRIGRESAAEGVRLGIETATKAFAPVLDTIVKTFEKIADSNADTVRKAMSAFVDGSGGELVRPAGCFPKRRSKKRKKVMKGSFDMAPYGYCPECFSAGCFPQPDGSILCFQGHRFDKDDAEYASTQIDLTGGIRERLAEFSAQIADGDLIEDGRETDFHITAKFGLHYSDATLVSAIVADFGPVHYYVSDFAAFQNDEYDVLYARVESDDLYRLNAKLSELCCTTTHPVYTPHATVAYLNPGLADKYIRRFGGISLRGTADTLTFSSPSREETKIPLGGTPLGAVAKGVVESDDESDPDPMDALTQAVVEEVYAAREQGDEDAVQAIIERYREMIDDPVLMEEHAGGVVKKGWSESDHPRSKTGQFIAKDDLKEAQTNPEKAKELREKVRPEDADKLEAVISGEKNPGRTKRGEQRHQAGQRREKKAANLKRANEIADKIAGGEGTAEDHHELADHLEGLTLDQLGILRSKIATRSGGRKKADVVGRLRDALRTGQSHAAVQRETPKDHARLAMSGFQPNRHDVADSNGEKVKAGTGYVRYEDGRPVGYSADDAERISSSVTPEDALARIDMHDAASKDEAVDPMLRDYHAELADQLRGHHEATFGAKGKITPPSTPSPELKPSHPSPDEKSVTRQAWAANQIRKRQGKPPVDYELKLVPLDSVKPSQHGEDYINDSSKELARKVAGGKRSDRQQDNDPIALDESGNIVDGNHRHAAATMNGEKAIWAIVPKQPSITPRLGPPGGGENSNEGAAFAEKKKKEDSSANAPPPSPPQSFKVFRGTGRGYANDHGVAGKGEYWSGAKQVAESYAGKNGKVSESTIHLERPLVLSYPELNSLQEKLYGRSLTGFEPDLSEKFDKWLRDAGYDGVALFDKEISEDIPQEVIKLAQSTPVGSTTRQRDGVATPKKPDQLPGGQADNAPDAAFPTDKLAEGQKHEGEHTTDPALAKEIAKDHLAEDPAYYDKLAKVEGGSASPSPEPQRSPAVASNTGPSIADQIAAIDKRLAEVNGDDPDATADQQRQMMRLMNEKSKLADQQKRSESAKPSAAATSDPLTPHIDRLAPLIEMGQNRVITTELAQKATAELEKMPQSQVVELANRLLPDGFTGKRKSDAIYAIRKRMLTANQGYAGADDWDNWGKDQVTEMPTVSEEDKARYREKHAAKTPAVEVPAAPAPSTAPKKPKAAPKPKEAVNEAVVNEHADRLAPLVERAKGERFSQEFVDETVKSVEHLPKEELRAIASKITGVGQQFIKTKQQALNDIRGKLTPLQRYDDSQLA